MPAFDPYAPLRECHSARLLAVLGTPDLRVPTKVRRLAISPDGVLGLVADDDGALTAWDLKSGAELGVLLRAKSGGVRTIAWAAGSALFVDGAGSVQRWDPRTGRLECVLAAVAKDGQRAVFSPDGRLVAVCSDEALELIDLKTCKPVRRFRCEVGLHHLAISPDGKKLLGSTYDNTLRVFEVAKGTQKEVPAKLESILAIGFAGAKAAAVAGEQNLMLIDFGAKPRRTVLHRGSWESYALTLAVSARGSHLVAGFSSGAVRVFSLKTLKPVLQVAHTDDVRAEVPEGLDAARGDDFGQAEKIESVAISADGKSVATSAKGSVRVFEVPAGEVVRPSGAHKARVVGLALLPGGEVASAGEDGLVLVRERKSGKRLREIAMRAPIHAAAIRGRLAWLGLRGAIEAYDLATGKRKVSIPVKRMNVVEDRVDSLALSTDGGCLVSGSVSGYVEVWDPKTGELRAQYKAREDDIVAALAVSASGWILAGDNKGRLRLIELSSGRELLALTAHKQRVASVALSADGRRAASATPTEMTLWELPAPGPEAKPGLKAVHGLKDLEPGFERPVCFSRDGGALFVGGRVVRVLDAHSGRELERLDLGPARDAATALHVDEEGGTLWAGTARGVALELALTGLPTASTLRVEPPVARPVAKGPFAPIASLSGQGLKEALLHHFAPWAVTAQCQAVLERLVERVRGCETSEVGELIITFSADGEHSFSVKLAQPFKGKAAPGTPLPPKSFWDVVRLHNGVRFEQGVPAELDLSGYDEEEGVLCDLPLEEVGGTSARQLGFCDAGHSWFFFDLKKRNKLDEPLICRVDAANPIAQAEPFPGQDKLAFGAGGFLLRALAHRVLGRDKAFAGCGWP